MANTIWLNEESLTACATWSLYEGIQCQDLMQNGDEDLPENDAVRRRRRQLTNYPACGVDDGDGRDGLASRPGSLAQSLDKGLIS